MHTACMCENNTHWTQALASLAGVHSMSAPASFWAGVSTLSEGHDAEQNVAEPTT